MDRWFVVTMRKRANRMAPTLDLSLPMTRERAIALTERVPLRSILAPAYSVKGRGREAVSRGPYWWAYFRRDGEHCRAYVGTAANRLELEQAHAMVRAEFEAEARKLAPETRALIDLENRLLGETPHLPPRLKKADPERAASTPGSMLGSSHPSRREASR